MNLSIPVFFLNRNLIIKLALIMLVLGSCSTEQPELISAVSSPESVRLAEESCQKLFVRENAQFIHSLNVSFPGSGTSTVLGVTSIDPKNRSFESVIMSLEGLVLFHVRFRGSETEIIKSVDPFSTKGFQEGLTGDIQLIFLPPDAKLIKSGNLSRNPESRACRFQTAENSLIDITVFPNRDWEIKQVDPEGHLLKTVQGIEVKEDPDHSDLPIPGKIVLKREGLFGYSLDMDLIDFTILN